MPKIVQVLKFTGSRAPVCVLDSDGIIWNRNILPFPEDGTYSQWYKVPTDLPFDNERLYKPVKVVEVDLDTTEESQRNALQDIFESALTTMSFIENGQRIELDPEKAETQVAKLTTQLLKDLTRVISPKEGFQQVLESLLERMSDVQAYKRRRR